MKKASYRMLYCNFTVKIASASYQSTIVIIKFGNRKQLKLFLPYLRYKTDLFNP